MKKIYYLFLLIFLTSCFNNSEYQDESEYQTEETSKQESNQKLIDICENMEGVVGADILDDILTIRANISEIEGQKLSEGMLSDIKKYDLDINSVIVLNLNYELMGHSGANK